MLQPVTKVVFIRKPKCRVEQKISLDEQLEERNSIDNVKIKCQKSRCKLFPLAVTSIDNHESYEKAKGDNSPPTQDRNTLFPPVRLHDQPMLLKTYFRGSLDQTRSRLALKKNFRKSAEKLLILKAKHGQVADAKSQRNCKKMKILEGDYSDEEQIHIKLKRKKLDIFSHPLPLNLLFPHLPKNGDAAQVGLPITGNCFSDYFENEMAEKLGRKWFQTESQKEPNTINSQKKIKSNESHYVLPPIKNSQNTPALNWFNGAVHYPYRRNLLLDWYTYDVCCPLPIQSWPPSKEKNDIEIVGTQFVAQGPERNPNVQSYIFNPPCDKSRDRTLKDFDGISLVQCFDESRHKPSFFNKVYAGRELNGKLPSYRLSRDSFLQETDANRNKIQNFTKRGVKTKRLPPLPVDRDLEKMNLKQVTKKFSARDYFKQQKHIQITPQ